MALSLRSFTARSIGWRFALAIGTGAAAILISLALANYFTSREILLEHTSSDALEKVHDGIHTMDNLVDRMAMLPMAIGANQIANEKEGGVTVPWLASLLEHCKIQAVFGLYMILDDQDWRNPDSFRWVNRKSWPGATRLNYDFHDPAHDWYRGAREKKGVYVTQPYFAEGGSEIEMISITQPVYKDDGHFIGVAGVDVSLEELSKIIGTIRIREFGKPREATSGVRALLSKVIHGTASDLHESASLITSDGTLILGPDSVSGKPIPRLSKAESSTLPGVKEILASDSGSFRIRDGSDQVLYWAKGDKTGWKLVLGIPYRLIVAQARDLAIESILIGGIGLILLLSVILIVARRVSEPIHELQVVASHFEKGAYHENDILERIGKRPDELGRFAKSFSAMAQEIQLREARLLETNSTLDQTVKNRTMDLTRTMKDLEQSNAAMAAEIAEAAAYSRAMLPPKLKGLVAADWIFETSSQLGGDSFGYHWLDDDHFALYLLDVCGHGVGAALLSVSVVNLLRTTSLTETDFLDPSAVLSSLNTTFPMERHNDMYFTAWYGVYTRSARTLSFACGGHPPAVLVSAEGETAILRTSGMIVGAFPSAVYETSTVPVPDGARLYLFSDGAYEIDRPAQPMMSYDDFVALLAGKQSGGAIDSVLAELRRQQGSDSFVDDVSLVAFEFGALPSRKSARLTLWATMAELDRLQGFLQDYCKEEHLSDEILFHLNVILEELATNVIKYGGGKDEEECCVIELSRNGLLLTIRFSDSGIPFNPLAQDEVDTNKTILERPIGGLGIHFVKSLTDSQVYLRENDRNVLILTKRI